VEPGPVATSAELLARRAPSASGPIDVLPPATEEPSLASKAAPIAIVLVLLWILRRIFGGSGDA
jgi:hypothetical protein